METLVQDVRFALRSLRKSSGFSLVAVLTLALGIGAATAIFSVANGVLLKPLPYDQPDQVVTVWASWDNFPEKTWLSVEEFQLFHQENRTLEDIALYTWETATFTSPNNPERVRATVFTPNIFSVLGVQPVVGRVPTWEEARDSVPPVLVSYELWQRRWNGDPGVVGATAEIDGTAMPVAGVLPRGFILPVDYASSSVSEVFFPYYIDVESPAQDPGGGGSHGAYGVGRLRDGVTVDDARSDLTRIMSQVEPIGLYSPERRFSPRVFPVKADIVGGARATLLLLMGSVALLLLIACGNVANLLLSRGETRVREVAVRTAVGAGKSRIFRQLLTESVVLALLGGALGLVLAKVGVDVLLSIDPASVPRSGSVSMDLPVLAFALGASLLTAVIFGAVPAARVARGGTGASLHESGRGAGAVSTRGQRFLVAAQMAMAVVLMAEATLMIRTFVSLLQVDPGFHPEHVLTFRLTTPEGAYPDTESVVAFYEELLRQVRAVPGVREAGAARLLPLASSMGDAGIRVDGYEPGPNESMQAEWQWATPGYLEVMNIPLMAGRTFDERDGMSGEEVIIINESLARRFWGDRDPLGTMARVFDEECVVVGVVGDVAHNGLTGSVKERFYRPHAQINGFAQQSLTITVETEGQPRSVLPPVREVVRRLDPSIPLAEIATMDEVMARSVAQPRFAMVLLGAFAGIALILALVGIYGVLSYAASRRTQEIGIRMALGAESGDVVRIMVRQGMVMAILGVAVGTAAAFSLTRLMEGMLYGVEATDPGTFTLVPTLFLVVALLACWIPAYRAARVDPADALRYE
jgi:predicted permease